MMSQRKKKLERTETTKDELLKWNEYYCRKKFGIGVECTKCHKWRRVFEYLDLYEVPELWECNMSTFEDGQKGNCDIPSTLCENSFVEDKYVPGTVVWAKYYHYSWWPGMVEDDPDTQLFYDKDEDSYNVTFFGKKVTRGWVKAENMSFFVETPAVSQPKKKIQQQDQELAKAQAEDALKMSLRERFQHYSFALLFKKRFPKSNKNVDVVPIDEVDNKMQLSNDFWTDDTKPKRRRVKTVSNSSLGSQASKPNKEVCEQNGNCLPSSNNKKRNSDTKDETFPVPDNIFSKSKRKRTNSMPEQKDKAKTIPSKKRQKTVSVSSPEEAISVVPKQRRGKAIITKSSQNSVEKDSANAAEKQISSPIFSEKELKNSAAPEKELKNSAAAEKELLNPCGKEHTISNPAAEKELLNSCGKEHSIASPAAEKELSPLNTAKNELTRNTISDSLSKPGALPSNVGHPSSNNGGPQATQSSSDDSEEDMSDDLSDASSTFNFTCSPRVTNGVDAFTVSSDEDIFGDDEESEDYNVQTYKSFQHELPFLVPAIPDTSGKPLISDVDPVPSQFILGELVIDPDNPKYQSYKYYTKPPQI